MAEILAGAEPFLLPGGKHGVLLIHGFTGSPAEMMLLGRYLQQAGYTVLAPRLCGHGTSPEEMAQTDWHNWYHSVCDGYYLLQNICTEISVVGLSMGGLLAIKLGLDYAVDSVITLSAPIHIADRKIDLLPSLERSCGQYVVKKRRPIPGLPKCYSVAYQRMPLTSVHSLLVLIKLVMENLANLRQPLLIMQSNNDHTVLPGSANYIYEHCGSADKKLVWLEKSGHLLTLDIEREQVFTAVAEFLSKRRADNS